MSSYSQPEKERLMGNATRVLGLDKCMPLAGECQHPWSGPCDCCTVWENRFPKEQVEAVKRRVKS